MTTLHSIAAGMMDDGYHYFVPGVNCWDCGRFVGRDGSIEVEHFEMSSEVASVEGQCRRCIEREMLEHPERFCAGLPPATF